MLVTHMMNNFYYCGKLSLKLLIFRLIRMYIGTLGMRQIENISRGSCPGPPARIWIHIITGLSTRLVCNIWCKNGKGSIFFFTFLWLGGGGGLFYTNYISVDLAHHEIFRAKACKGGITPVSRFCDIFVWYPVAEFFQILIFLTKF